MAMAGANAASSRAIATVMTFAGLPAYLHGSVAGAKPELGFQGDGPDGLRQVFAARQECCDGATRQSIGGGTARFLRRSMCPWPERVQCRVSGRRRSPRRQVFATGRPHAGRRDFQYSADELFPHFGGLPGEPLPDRGSGSR
jgi:hypothetical protein